MSKTAALIGATGFIGGFLLEQLLDDPFFERVVILIRRPVDLIHPKLEKKLVDFTDPDSILIALNDCDVLFCAIGTTNKKVKGDKGAYRKVDYDIPVLAAQCCAMIGCPTFVLVSSVGANSKSRNFYLQLKGEVEGKVKEMGLESVHIMRPSLLLGDRKEARAGEKIGKLVMGSLTFLIPSKYKPVHGAIVANAMLSASKKNKPGYFIYEYREIISLASKL
jgi:uncharacterized protein YbjT (DUF2867 family)